MNVSGKRPEEKGESFSTKLPSSKKSENSSRKGKPVKAANSLQKKQKAQPVGQIKSQGQMNLKPLYPATGKSVVVVESVTKAKVIQGYLGNMYEVLPSYGHVRDLAARSGSVRPDDEFSMVWEVPSAAWTHLKSIKVSLSGYDFSSFSVMFNQPGVTVTIRHLWFNKLVMHGFKDQFKV